MKKKYSKSINNGALLDLEFNKPQAFHFEAISRSGGIACLVSLLIFIGCTGINDSTNEETELLSCSGTIIEIDTSRGDCNVKLSYNNEVTISINSSIFCLAFIDGWRPISQSSLANNFNISQSIFSFNKSLLQSFM